MKNINQISTLEPDPAFRQSIETLSIFELIEEYKKVCDKLERVAEAKPTTPREIRDVIDHEAMLLDMQAEILNNALQSSTKNMADVKALLWLWRSETVDSQSLCSLTEADKIILSVCNYLKIE